MVERIGIAGASKDEQAQSATDHNARPDADYRNLENVRKLLERGGEVNVGEVLAALVWALEEIKRLEPQADLHCQFVQRLRASNKRMREEQRKFDMGFSYTPSPSDEEFDKDEMGGQAE